MAMLVPAASALASGALASTVAGTTFGIANAVWVKAGIGLASAAISYAMQPKQTGPRLDNLTVTGSAYGTPIPIVYGAAKIGGQVIWASKITEEEHD